MYITHFRCVQCDREYPKKPLPYRCCYGGSLEAIYDLSMISQFISWPLLRRRNLDHYRYKEFYPEVKEKYIVSLGEGGTPLVPSRNLKNVYFKMENQNPTGSFKDRGSTLELSYAKSIKAKRVLCASTGNMGASVAAYAARAKIPATIFVPGFAPKAKLAQMERFGAEIVKLKGDYTMAAKKAYNMYQRKKGHLVGDYVFRGEGEKSVGYEMLDQIDADYIIVPMGNGTLIGSIWKACKEFHIAHLIKKLPKLIGVQASGCQPIVKAFQQKKNIKPVTAKTQASAIACGEPLDGDKAIRALQESLGKGIVVSDKEIKEARNKLNKEGIDAELSGAVGLAGFTKLKIPKRKKVVIMITGHGLKDILA